MNWAVQVYRSDDRASHTRGTNIVRWVVLLKCALFFSFHSHGADTPGLAEVSSGVRTFRAQGVVRELKSDGKTIVITHEAIANYMEAMTMPFRVKEPRDLAGLRSGDTITFRLNVTEEESWIDQVIKTGGGRPGRSVLASEDSKPRPARPRHPLLDYKFTNELGQAVSLGDFQGQALAITFFFTRCPIPDYCPRLSKNFAEASRKLSSLPNAPTNWHFLSVTFDPSFDTPAILKAYGEGYGYNPARWNFLTGPLDKIGELASQSDVTFKPENGFLNHNFRTLIIDATGHLQTVFPVGGNLTDAIVSEVLKAATATNPPT